MHPHESHAPDDRPGAAPGWPRSRGRLSAVRTLLPSRAAHRPANARLGPGGLRVRAALGRFSRRGRAGAGAYLPASRSIRAPAFPASCSCTEAAMRWGAPKSKAVSSTGCSLRTRDCVIVAPDYRKSLEGPYPAAVNDGYGSLLWLKQYAAALGVRQDQLFVMGMSAGGGLHRRGLADGAGSRSTSGSPTSSRSTRCSTTGWSRSRRGTTTHRSGVRSTTGSRGISTSGALLAATCPNTRRPLSRPTTPSPPPTTTS